MKEIFRNVLKNYPYALLKIIIRGFNSRIHEQKVGNHIFPASFARFSKEY